MHGLWTANPRKLVMRMTAPTFWNSAMPSNMVERPSKVTWDDAWVAELRRGFKAAGTFALYPLYWCVDRVDLAPSDRYRTCYNQARPSYARCD